MLDMRLIDLQLFSDAGSNVNTTLGYRDAYNGTLTPFLAVLLPQLVFGAAAVYLIHIAPK